MINLDYDLSKFHEAQENSYQRVLEEMKAGRKRTHWIWYIFPQLRSLGKSRIATYYGLENLAEAKAYLADEILRSRLIEVSQAVLDVPSENITYIMGSRIDVTKLCSSMTLFLLADPTCEVFKKVLDKYFDGKLDEKTVNLCNDDKI